MVITIYITVQTKGRKLPMSVVKSDIGLIRGFYVKNAAIGNAFIRANTRGCKSIYKDYPYKFNDQDI